MMRAHNLPANRKRPARERAEAFNNVLIGGRLRHARLNQRISLKQLAAEVQCTESFLSKVENDKVRPSLTMLHRIVVALDINVATLFTPSHDAEAPVTVMSAGKRPILKTAHLRTGRGIRLEALIPAPRAVLLEANIHHVMPGASSRGVIHHKGEEMGYVLQGQLELIVEKKVFRVNEGDTFFFPSHLPHGYRNTGKVEAKILWVNTPQSF
jgi:transcriptional regulator with XRE-family HTH domain